MSDPGALSAVFVQVSNTSGLGSYTLGVPIRDKRPLSEGYPDGSTLTYHVTDSSGTVEVARGVLTGNTLTRTLVISSTGALIDWPATGQRNVTPLLGGLSICLEPPNNGQVLIWDALVGEWCPGDVVLPEGPDDDLCDMQIVTTGNSYSVTLTKFDTQVVWRSPVSSAMFTLIPAASAHGGKTLDIKTTMVSGQTMSVILDGGTIGGSDSWTFLDDMAGGCNIMLRADGVNSDWIIRCLCCIDASLPLPTPPAPLSAASNHITLWEFFHGPSNIETFGPAPGPYLTSVAPSGPVIIQQYPSNGDAAPIYVGTDQQDWIVAFVLTQNDTDAPAVDNIQDNFGLTWQLRSASNATMFCSGTNSDQNIRLETWWADCSTVPVDSSVSIIANLAGLSLSPEMIVTTVYNVAGWDESTDFPASVATAETPTFPLRTQASQSVMFCWIVSPNFGTPTTFPSPGAGHLFFSQDFYFNTQNFEGTGPFYTTITPLHFGRCAATSFNRGRPSNILFTGDRPPPWGGIDYGGPLIPGTLIGGGNRVNPPQFFNWLGTTVINEILIEPNSPVITDGDYSTVYPIPGDGATPASGPHRFVCNSPGYTGPFGEPAWNTSEIGAITIETISPEPNTDPEWGNATWAYLGTAPFSAKPFYINEPPRWNDPFVGGGHWLQMTFYALDSTGSHMFQLIAGNGSRWRNIPITNWSVGAGNTGDTEPAWDTTTPSLSGVDGSQTVDGNCLWLYLGTWPPIQSRNLFMDRAFGTDGSNPNQPYTALFVVDAIAAKPLV